MDLADCSPKAEKTKKQCALACIFMLDNPMLVENLASTKQFPLKLFKITAMYPENIGAASKILNSRSRDIVREFPYMKEYLRYIEEVRRNESGRS